MVKENVVPESPKKFNSGAKGARNQRKTALYFRERGFRVETVKASRRNSTDFFGKWDHIAVALKGAEIGSKAYKKGDVLFIQTKSNRAPSGKELQKYNDPDFPNRMIFVWKDRERQPRIKILED